MLKKAFIFFLVTLSSLAFAANYVEHSRQARREVRDMESTMGEVFMIPHDAGSFEIIYELLLETAHYFSANIFRSSMISVDEMNKFALLTTETEYFENWSLTSGRPFTVEESQYSDYFLATGDAKDANQIGTITYFGKRTSVTIAPLRTAANMLPIGGTYYAELPADISIETFLTRLVDRINEEDANLLEEVELGENQWMILNPLEVSDFQINEPVEMTPTFRLSDEEMMISLLVVITMIICIYYSASLTKKASVLKMNGLSNGQIWNRLLGKTLNTSFGITSIIMVVASVILSSYYHDFQFFGVVLWRQIQIYGVLIGLSGVNYWFIRRMSVHQGIKNKRKTRFVLGFNVVLKMGLSLGLLLVGFVGIKEYREFREQLDAFDNWRHSEDFGVFSGMYWGDDLTDPFADGWWYVGDSLRAVANHELYPILNERGALLVDAWLYHDLDFNESRSINLIGPDGFNGIRHMRVNPNFLTLYPLVDHEGYAVNIEEAETDFILLVPEKYRELEWSIINFFENSRDWLLMEEERYGIDVPETVLNQDLQIIWLQNEQSVFTFNRRIFPENQNNLVDPIIQVVTEANSFVDDRGNIDTLKIRLLEQDHEKTYQDLLPILQQLELDDNLIAIHTVNESVLNELSNVRLQVMYLLFIAAGMSMIALALSLQATILFFHEHLQKYVMHRIFGVGFWKTYRNFFSYFVGVWLIQCLLIFTIASHLSVQPSTILVATFLGGELLLSLTAMTRLEKKNKLAILKGEA